MVEGSKVGSGAGEGVGRRSGEGDGVAAGEGTDKSAGEVWISLGSGLGPFPGVTQEAMAAMIKMGKKPGPMRLMPLFYTLNIAMSKAQKLFFVE
jgi:hypothetical protein